MCVCVCVCVCVKSSALSMYDIISFSCLLVLARIDSTMLNRCSKSEHLHLVPGIREKAYTFSPLKMLTVTS